MPIITAVQEERGPRKPKSSSPKMTRRSKNSKMLLKKDDNSKSPNVILDQSFYDLTAHILLKAIKQVRNSTFFGILDRTSQDECLKIVWGPIFLLKAAHWTNWIPPGPRELISTILHIRSLYLDGIEVKRLCLPNSDCFSNFFFRLLYWKRLFLAGKI